MALLWGLHWLLSFIFSYTPFDSPLEPVVDLFADVIIKLLQMATLVSGALLVLREILGSVFVQSGKRGRE